MVNLRLTFCNKEQVRAMTANKQATIKNQELLKTSRIIITSP